MPDIESQSIESTTIIYIEENHEFDPPLLLPIFDRQPNVDYKVLALNQEELDFVLKERATYNEIQQVQDFLREKCKGRGRVTYSS